MLSKANRLLSFGGVFSLFSLFRLSCVAFLSPPFAFHSYSAMAMSSDNAEDGDFPGTAYERMYAIRDRVKALDSSKDLSIEWEAVRRSILNAGGLKDLASNVPGEGYTGHSFNDYNHCDLTAMKLVHKDNENQGRVQGIATRNPLGRGISIASLGEADGLPAGGSWSTCILGSHLEPPQDVAHVQFQSKIAFKLVWAPPSFTSFVLVDDDGNLLNYGTPVGSLPSLRERQQNYAVVQGGRYSKAAEQFAASKM